MTEKKNITTITVPGSPPQEFANVIGMIIATTTGPVVITGRDPDEVLIHALAHLIGDVANTMHEDPAKFLRDATGPAVQELYTLHLEDDDSFQLDGKSGLVVNAGATLIGFGHADEGTARVDMPLKDFLASSEAREEVVGMCPVWIETDGRVEVSGEAVLSIDTEHVLTV